MNTCKNCDHEFDADDFYSADFCTLYCEQIWWEQSTVNGQEA